MPWADRIRMSLRWRLTLAFAVAMTGILAALGTLVYFSVSSELLAAVDRDLGVRADALTSALAADPSTPLEGGHRFVDPDEAFAQVIDAHGATVDSTAGVTGHPLLSAAAALAVVRPQFFTEPATARDDPRRLLAVPAQIDRQPRIVVVGQTLGDRNDALARLLELFAVLGPIALLATSTGGWVLAGRALRPVDKMRRRATELAMQDGLAQLPVPSTRDELARLAQTLNSLLARVHTSAERELRFVDDASHELRTPLAVLKAELDLSLSRPRGAEDLQDTVRAAARETDRLVRLAEDLLVLARVRQQGLPVKRRLTDVADLIESSVGPARAAADAAGREIVVRAVDSVVDVDPDRMRQALLNLLDNALRHGAGTVTVTTSQDASGFSIEVRDEGPGIAPALRSTAFEPFRRGPSLDGPLGGSGLGLSIVRAVVEAHSGTATAFAEQHGAGVRLWLPSQVGGRAIDARPPT
jgi:two-component system OmpR family sensor kinase